MKKLLIFAAIPLLLAGCVSLDSTLYPTKIFENTVYDTGDFKFALKALQLGQERFDLNASEYIKPTYGDMGILRLIVRVPDEHFELDCSEIKLLDAAGNEYLASAMTFYSRHTDMHGAGSLNVKEDPLMVATLSKADIYSIRVAFLVPFEVDLQTLKIFDEDVSLKPMTMQEEFSYKFFRDKTLAE